MHNNERVIFQDDKNGYVIKLTSLKDIKNGLKGCKITVKRMKNGNVLKGNLCYEWFKSEKQAKQLFDFYTDYITENRDITLDNWIFNYHPFRFMLKHRN